MCLKNRMTDEEGQRLLDLLHLLKNDTGLLETVRPLFAERSAPPHSWPLCNVHVREVTWHL